MAHSDALVDGAVLAHYRIDERLGAGGMGVVYRATDLRLTRTVALKVIGGTADQELRRRFLKEARSASAFTHPNIVTIHEVDTAGEIDFIVMELLSGQSLNKRIASGTTAIDDVVSIGEQMASALAAAHAANIVHRDVKPANVMVSDSGHVKLLDFGIAKQLARPASADVSTLAVIDPTAAGAVIGSVSYMSPEQAQGHAVDGRSDMFSFGILLYELLAGRRPFGGTTAVETLAKILEATPLPIGTIRGDVPANLVALVTACLEKDRNRRPSAIDAHRQLADLRRDRAGSTARVRALLRRRAVVLPAIAAMVLMVLAGAWWWQSGRESREARRRLPAVLDLAARGDTAFYAAASALLKVLPDEPRLRDAFDSRTFVISEINSVPAGAQVLLKPYMAADDQWVMLGVTPLESPRFAGGTTNRIRMIKDGYAPLDGTFTVFALNAALDPLGSVPEAMVHVPRGTVSLEGTQAEVADFWLDKFEVTNRQFKAFVDAGGYTTQAYWKEPLVREGRTIEWAAAMQTFRDRTGRLGPATWELGTFPEGQAAYPVGGVSWYEAAAYAVFAGKALPTAFQWRMSGDFVGPSAVFGDILLRSNFNGKGPTAVGALNGVGPYGQYDMAGNVKEWCWNESRGGRMILGGGWNEPKYMYEDRDAQPPFNRAATFGIRLVKNPTALPAASYEFLRANSRDYSIEKPIDDASFAMVKRLYDYDPRPLNSRIETIEDAPDWRRETVTLDAAYPDERVIAYLYLPKTAAPPYQTVVYFPGGDAPMLRSSRQLNLTNVDFLIRSGRALVYPVYKGTYERRFTVTGPNALRDLTIARVKDFRRVVDYMATRADLDHERIGYFGVSLGAFHGTIISSIDARLKANVFMGGGLIRSRTLPEVDPLNFVPRIHVPTLMVNGTSDFQFPLEGTQLPEFRLLPLPPDRKRHALFDGGHMPNQIHDVMREILDWFDRFLGPVKSVANAGRD